MGEEHLHQGHETETIDHRNVPLAKEESAPRVQRTSTIMSSENERVRVENGSGNGGFSKAVRVLKHGFVGFMVGVFVTLGVVYTAFDIGRKYSPDQGDDFDLIVLQEKIERCNELATATYLYTDAEAYKPEGAIFGLFDIPFLTGKEFIVKYSGAIKAGVNLDDVRIERGDGGGVLVDMPAPYIISHEIDEGSFQILREHETLFSSIKINDMQEFREKEKESMEKRANESGVLKEAEENARSSIRSILEVSLPEGTSIEFEPLQKQE